MVADPLAFLPEAGGYTTSFIVIPPTKQVQFQRYPSNTIYYSYDPHRYFIHAVDISLAFLSNQLKDRLIHPVSFPFISLCAIEHPYFPRTRRLSELAWFCNIPTPSSPSNNPAFNFSAAISYNLNLNTTTDSFLSRNQTPVSLIPNTSKLLNSEYPTSPAQFLRELLPLYLNISVCMTHQPSLYIGCRIGPLFFFLFLFLVHRFFFWFLLFSIPPLRCLLSNCSRAGHNHDIKRTSSG